MSSSCRCCARPCSDARALRDAWWLTQARTRRAGEDLCLQRPAAAGSDKAAVSQGPRCMAAGLQQVASACIARGKFAAPGGEQ
eukprot:361461-Chlamydomonas_euryale.AAC.3